MYQPLDQAAGPQGAAEANGQVEPPATAAGDGLQDDQGNAEATGRRPTHVTALLAEIARAMQAAAAKERERIQASMGEDEASQIDKVHARATAESAALRNGADDDMRRIEAWCDEQIQQIRLEAERRGEERRSELEHAVRQHGLLIETEVQSVHGAVVTYRASLDAFFARLAEEGDPSAIAGMAGTLPDPPDLDAVRADARSRAMKAIEEDASTEDAAASGEGPTAGGTAIAEGPTEGGAASGEGPTEDAAPSGEGPTEDAPTSGEGPTEEGAIDAPGTLPPSVEALVPVMEPAPEEVPVPVMDPAVGASSQEGMAARMIRSLTSWTSPTGADDKGS